MNNPLESSHTRTMSTDSMPSNVSEDYSYIPNKNDPYQLQSFISLEKKVLSDFNRSNYPNGCQKKLSNPNNQISPSSSLERRGLNNVNSEIFMPPKVHIPYQSHQKKIIKECRTGGRERQTVAFDRVENRKREEKASYVSNDQNFLKNRLKRLPLDMPLQISPKPDMTIDLGQLSQKKADIHRQSRSFDEGYEKQPNELVGVSRIQKLQSPKTFTYCLPKVISVDKASENFLSGGTSQLSESNIENKNPLNGSSLIMNEDKLKSKLSPEGKTMNKFILKEEFNFTNILIDAEKKLNQTPQQSTSRFSPKKVIDDYNAVKGELRMVQQDPLYYVEIEQGTSSQDFVIEQENKSGSHSVKGRVTSVPQSLINRKSATKTSKENQKPGISASSQGKKSTKQVWNNYTQQVRKEMKQNFPIKENKKLLINTLFEFDPTSPSNVHSSGMDSSTSNLERPTAGNSKPSTFYTMIEERHTEKPKKSSKKDGSYDSMEISLPLQIDHSRNDPSVMSITNREKPRGSMREDQGKSCDQIYQRSGQKKDNNNNNSSFLTYEQERIISKDNSLQMNNRDFEVNQSASSLKSRKDEDLSEFIRIELGLSQEEQIFQPPCLIRTSFLLKKGISQALKEMENNEKSIEQESEQLSSAYNSNTAQNAFQENHSEIKGLDEQSYLNKSSNGNPLSSFNGMDRSNLSNLNPDIMDSFTTNEHPKASRRVASKGYSKQGNFVKYFNTSNATIESKNENYSTQSKSSKEFTVPFDELTNNIISNKKMIDLLNRKNESMLLQMLEKSGVSGTNTSSDENALQTSIRALLQAEHQKNLQSIELFRSSNRLPTIEEMNSVHMQLNTRPDNHGLSELEKVRVSVSHFSDRCISEPNGFCFKKNLIYEPDLISKSFDDVNCLGYFSNKIIHKNYLDPHDEAQENEDRSHLSPRMRKSQSESKIGSLHLVQRLFLQSQKINMEGTQGTSKSFKTPTGQMQRLRSFIQTGDTIIQSRNRRGNSAKSISRTKDFSMDCRDHRSMSRVHHSKRSSVAADRSRDMTKFAFTLIEAPQNIQTYTIIDKPKRSASSDPSKRKINEKSLSSTHLTPIHMNLQKKIASQSNLLTCKEHQKNIKENFGKTH